MRKHLIIVLAVMSVLTLCSCGSKQTDKTTVSQIKKETTSEKKNTEKTKETEETTTQQSIQETTTGLTVTNDTMYAVSAINVRNKPDTEGEIVTVLNAGEEVKRLGTLENGWSKISINGNEECYVNSSYITSEKPTEMVTETVQETSMIIVETQPETQPQTDAQPQTEVQPQTDAQQQPEQQPELSPEEQKEKAQQYVGSDIDSLINAIGKPSDSLHASSCYYEGEQDGIFYYPTFTVYTHTVKGIDYIDYIE